MQSPEADPEDAGSGEFADLLASMLDRPLTRLEQDRLNTLLIQDPSLSADLALLELIALHRAHLQIEIGAQRAQENFSALVDSAAIADVPKEATAVPRSWLGWLADLLAQPMLVGACLVTQFVVIGLLVLGQGHEYSAERGMRSSPACGRFLVLLDDHLTLRELRRVLVQSDLRILDGPDAQGRYAITGADTLLQAQQLLRQLNAEVAINPACPNKP